MAWPNLRGGDRNLAVRALQSALARELRRLNVTPRNTGNGTYGKGLAADVHAWKLAQRIAPTSGTVFGQTAWRRLWPRMTRRERRWVVTARAQLAAKAAARRAAEAAERVMRRRQTVANAALELYARGRPVLIYTQRRPFPLVWSVRALRYRLDCSSTATLCYWRAGAPDPNGYGWPASGEAYGWTGSLWPRGERVDIPMPGDLAFYGWDTARRAPKHVAIVVTGLPSVQVVTFGHTPISRTFLRYRSDLIGVRRYPME